MCYPTTHAGASKATSKKHAPRTPRVAIRNTITHEPVRAGTSRCIECRNPQRVPTHPPECPHSDSRDAPPVRPAGRTKTDPVGEPTSALYRGCRAPHGRPRVHHRLSVTKLGGGGYTASLHHHTSLPHNPRAGSDRAAVKPPAPPQQRGVRPPRTHRAPFNNPAGHLPHTRFTTSTPPGSGPSSRPPWRGRR